jgi:predicted dehydrogenase
MLTRRTFAKVAATVVAAPYVITSRALANAASDRFNVAVIGNGTMGRGHLSGLLGRNDVQVVGVCDVVKERIDQGMENIAKKHAERTKGEGKSDATAYRDIAELLARPGLDAVLIALPDHWHSLACVMAARAGKHIYCEKPLTHNIAEGRRVVNEVAKAGVVFQTGSQQRTEFGGHFRKAVELIWAGRIGTIKKVRIGVGGPAVACDLPEQDIPEGTAWDRWLGPGPARGYNEVLCPKGVHGHFPAWRNYREYAGGAIADMGAHHFDIAQWAMKTDRSGPVEVVPPSDASANEGLVFRYNNGVEMIHNVFEETKGDCVFEGTEGILWVSRSGIGASKAEIVDAPLSADAERVNPATNHHADWLDCIRTKKECICPAEVGHRSATICHLGNIGYRLRRPLKWDPEKEQFAGDEEANGLTHRAPRAGWDV